MISRSFTAHHGVLLGTVALFFRIYLLWYLSLWNDLHVASIKHAQISVHWSLSCSKNLKFLDVIDIIFALSIVYTSSIHWLFHFVFASFTQYSLFLPMFSLIFLSLYVLHSPLTPPSHSNPDQIHHIHIMISKKNIKFCTSIAHHKKINEYLTQRLRDRLIQKYLNHTSPFIITPRQLFQKIVSE